MGLRRDHRAPRRGHRRAPVRREGAATPRHPQPSPRRTPGSKAPVPEDASSAPLSPG